MEMTVACEAEVQENMGSTIVSQGCSGKLMSPDLSGFKHCFGSPFESSARSRELGLGLWDMSQTEFLEHLCIFYLASIGSKSLKSK